MFTSNPPLGLYIHIPWCEKKCPYCDFNSHEIDVIPEREYVQALLRDLEQDLPLIWGRSIETIFIGGGTPSLFSGQAMDQLFSGLRALLNFSPGIEITIESNPSSADTDRYKAYFDTGINRLSIGIQSFNNKHLSALGRVHDSKQALEAIDKARAAGFTNINLDLMYGLPEQSLQQACDDLAQAIALAPSHISQYQLTIEPNTLFHHKPPKNIADDDLSWDQQLASQSMLKSANYNHYEISAYGADDQVCQHNVNYWQFGDYLGIGAGAHGKITIAAENKLIRRVRQRQPKAYMQNIGQDCNVTQNTVDTSDLIFEFMLNASRLITGFDTSLFHENTGLSYDHLLPGLQLAENKGLIRISDWHIGPTELGFQYLNDLQLLFLNTAVDKKTTKNKPFFDSRNGIMHN